MQNEPVFNLKAAVQQTGLKADTLRAWERRYGLPSPARSGGGHRLYSRRDIDIIRWLVARQREGLSISSAVELWHQLQAGGQDPLQPSASASMPSLAEVARTVRELRRAWISACLAYDEERAEQALSQAFALYPPESVAVELLERGVAEIGEGWYRGEVTVQQEHFCSAMVVRRLEGLIMAAAAPSRPDRILAACPPQENHVISLLLLTLLMRRRGWPVVYLGADVPLERLETTVAATRPRLVILAAQQLHTAANLLDMSQALVREGVTPAYGGLVFNRLPALRARIPGHFLGERLDRAPQVAEALMIAPRPLPEVKAVAQEYAAAREHFLTRQPLIEAELSRMPLQRTGIAREHMAVANHELALNVAAALALGDMELVGLDIRWVESLLGNRRLPDGALHAYLEAYLQAARTHLDRRGGPVVDWLARLLADRAGDRKESD